MLVALGVTGGIAAYKACEIVRGLDKAGVEVQVLMTRNATRFIPPLTLQTLSRRKVLLRTFDTEQEQTIQHIELAREIDAMVVAPATANAMAKFAHGIADDLLSTFFVSVDAPVVIAPAMNTRMWNHPATVENLRRLRAMGVEIVDPESGWLAEQEIGPGRMADPASIVARVLATTRRRRTLAGRKIVVSAGPTREPIDPVRYVSNRSSGKMGYALASACADRGADVTLVSGPVRLDCPRGVRRIDVVSAAQMREAMLKARDGADAVFMAAAVADFIPRAAASKIKKGGGGLELSMDPAPDILAELGGDRRERLLVGFAAETESLVEHAREKLERKNVDFIVANDVSRPDIGLDADDNAVTILSREGGVFDVPRCSKRDVAEAIVNHVLGPGVPAEVGS